MVSAKFGGETLERHMGERNASHSTNAKWLEDLKADHSNLIEHEQAAITKTDINLRQIEPKVQTVLTCPETCT